MTVAPSTDLALSQRDVIRHELGHAIVAGMLGHGVSRVSVNRQGAIGGQVTTHPPTGRDSFRLALEEIEIMLGGPVAQPMPGQHGDIGAAANLARELTLSDREAEALLRWLVIRVEERLAQVAEARFTQLESKITAAGGELDLGLAPVRDERGPLIELQAPIVNVIVDPTPVTVEAPVTVNVPASPPADVTVTVEATNKTVKFARDADGNIIEAKTEDS